MKEKKLNEINKELQHHVEVMKAQKHIELSGPIDEVNNYIQALSRIYEIAADIQDQTNKIEEITKVALTCEGNLTIDHLSFSVGKILGIATRTKEDERKMQEREN